MRKPEYLNAKDYYETQMLIGGWKHIPWLLLSKEAKGFWEQAYKRATNADSDRRPGS
jgi:hypothetical protein